jgi:peroxiredoxin
MKKITLILSVLIIVLSNNLFAKGPGDKVPDFTIKNYDGNTYSLSNVKDAKGVIIVFWSAECPFVQAYNDRINDYVSEFQKKGFVFWAINSNTTESVSDVEAHAKSHNYVFPVLKDENSVVADLFEATRTPEVFVLNSDNVIVYHGRIDDNKNKSEVTTYDLQNAVNDISGGKEVAVKATKQFGCTIKRANKQ